MTDTTLVGNSSDDGAVTVATSSVALYNDIFAGSVTGLVQDAKTTVFAGYNLYWELDTADTGYSTDGGDVYDDPDFVAAFQPSACGTEPWLAEGSPAINTGYPHWSDEDGSRSDIGAFDVELDPGDDTGTGDDTGEATDDTARTDDTAVDTAPALDSDGDGTPDAEDCGPGDPTVHPGATDDPFDDIDQDCDGNAASGAARGGCDCDTAGVPPATGLLLAALALARRRR